MEGKRSEKLLVFVTRELKEALEISAKAEDRSVSNYAGWILERAMRERLGSRPAAAAQAYADRRVPVGEPVPKMRDGRSEGVRQNARVMSTWMPSVRRARDSKEWRDRSEEEFRAFVAPYYQEFKAGLRETLDDPPELLTPQGDLR